MTRGVKLADDVTWYILFWRINNVLNSFDVTIKKTYDTDWRMIFDFSKDCKIIFGIQSTKLHLQSCTECSFQTVELCAVLPE